ncbi:polysaccharide biosynthesis tyrosine autokinase [Blautia sp. MSJ-9]|uniref:polysaccharide biosynthesis tyrosine autokinase n=1 Tax=Blautia sp. MSJ-9 TaxID=2841511 RepID=UPI001C10E619|nr:polysaccharide biosynthesis tyrosine autokinase [Blautia sp. MSJ-9]MBU5679471.1 AAA family ATPase [Blautia sp. MSJ-9]
MAEEKDNKEKYNNTASGKEHGRYERKQLQLIDVIYAVRKHLLLIVLCTGIGLILGIALSVVSYMRGEMSKSYAIKAAIAVTSQNENGLFTTQSNDPNSTDIYLAEDMVDSVIFVMKSDKVLDAAVERLNLMGVSTKDIYNNLIMEQYNKTQVIEITLYWRSAQEGIEILNAIMEVAPNILVETLKIGNVSVINQPKSQYLIGGSLNASMWVYMAVLGMAFGVGLSVIMLLLSPTLLKTSDMERLFGLEILGEIPEEKGFFRKKRNLILTGEDDWAGSDILDNYVSTAHILKNRIKTMDHPCIYVTSAAKNEGKTTVTAYLAVQLAELGMKVLLIDFDTRNPKLGGLFLNKVEYEHSLNALYRGETSTEEAITKLTGNLDILPSVLERKPVPLDDALLDLVSHLHEGYDVLLMDTAPVGQVADTMSLNQLADIALLVVGFDKAGMEEIRDALSRLKKSGMEIMGCVVNSVKELKKNKSYGYYHGDGYHGSHGTEHRHNEKTERQKEWEQWEKKHSDEK